MNLKAFLIIGAAVAVVYGIAFLLVPALVLKTYGSQIDPSVVLGYRYFGVALLTAGLAIWAVRDCRDPATLKDLLVGLGIADLAGVAVSLWGTLTGTINALGWMNVLLYAALLAGCAYFYRGGSRTAQLAI